MSAVYKTESHLIQMKSNELILHYRDLIHVFGVGTEPLQRIWRDWYYVNHNYHEIVNEKLRSIPWLQSNKSGVVEFVTYIVIGCGMGGGAGKVFSTVITKPIKDEKKKILVKEICVVGGGIGGGLYGAYKFTEKVEDLPQFTEWKTRNLKISVIEFINQKYCEDEFLEQFVCPITNQIIEEPVKCFNTFYEYNELVKSKNPETGIIKDPKRNGEIHERDLTVQPRLQFLISKRIEWCVKADLVQYASDKKYTESLQKVLEHVQKNTSEAYQKVQQKVEAIRNDPSPDRKEVRKKYQEAQNGFFNSFGVSAGDDINWNTAFQEDF